MDGRRAWEEGVGEDAAPESLSCSGDPAQRETAYISGRSKQTADTLTWLTS